MLLSSIRSFRAIQRGEVVAGGELKIKFVQATEFFDFSIVSQNSKIANFPRGNSSTVKWVLSNR